LIRRHDERKPPEKPVNLNERERKIAVAVIAVVVGLLIYYFVFQPYSETRAEVLKSQSDVQDQLDHADRIFARQRRLKSVWADMQKGGLNVGSDRAKSQTMDALDRWARATGFSLVTYKADKTTQDGTFEIVSFSASGTGSMPQVARMLAAIETAEIPVRVNDMTITPQKEGTDDLSVRFTLSALCQPPADATAKPSQADGGSPS
jgi:hypothetical protein